MSYEQRVKERIVKSLPERFRYGCYRGKAYPHTRHLLAPKRLYAGIGASVS